MTEPRLASPTASRPRGAEDRTAFTRGCLLLTTLLLATARYGNAAVPPAARTASSASRRPDPYLGRDCYYLRSLGLDYLNDAEQLPHALSITSGTLEPGQAAEFKVLGESYQGVYWDVSHYFTATRYSSRALRVTVRPAPGSRSVAGKLRLLPAAQGIPQRIQYTPAKVMSVDRTALLTFTLLCDRPLSTQFTLQIPAGR